MEHTDAQGERTQPDGPPAPAPAADVVPSWRTPDPAPPDRPATVRGTPLGTARLIRAVTFAEPQAPAPPVTEEVPVFETVPLQPARAPEPVAPEPVAPEPAAPEPVAPEPAPLTEPIASEPTEPVRRADAAPPDVRRLDEEAPSAVGRLVAVIVTLGLSWALLVAITIWVLVLIFSKR